MNEKEIINLIKNDSALKADDRIWENTKKRINAGDRITSEYIDKKRTLIFRIIAYFCIALVLLLLYILLNLSSPTVRDQNEPIAVNGEYYLTFPLFVHQSPYIPIYHRYNGKYYILERPANNTDDPVSKVFVYIQDKIVKRLYMNYYEIAGIDSSKSIAYFDGHYYYKLDYAFQDSVTFNGKPYLISANEHYENIVNPRTGEPILNTGESLGKAGDYEAYVLS